MAVSSFINKQTIVNGVTFAPNNFVALLEHETFPSEFHIIQDFLASSPISYALTQPVQVSFLSVIQVWNTAVFGKVATSGKPHMMF